MMPRAKDEGKDERPFSKGSLYMVRSLGTHDAPIETHGEFVGFTQVGMSGEALMIRLGKEHGKEKGLLRLIPAHMVLHVDVVKAVQAEEKKKEDSPVSYS